MTIEDDLLLIHNMELKRRELPYNTTQKELTEIVLGEIHKNEVKIRGLPDNTTTKELTEIVLNEIRKNEVKIKKEI